MACMVRFWKFVHGGEDRIWGFDVSECDSELLICLISLCIFIAILKLNLYASGGQLANHM